MSDSSYSSDKNCGGPSKKSRIDKKKSYKQKFRAEWPHNKDFSSWLREYPKNPYKAMCCLCDTTMQAEVSVLKRHNAGTKHQPKEYVHSTTINFKSISNDENTGRGGKSEICRAQVGSIYGRA